MLVISYSRQPQVHPEYLKICIQVSLIHGVQKSWKNSLNPMRGYVVLKKKWSYRHHLCFICIALTSALWCCYTKSFHIGNNFVNDYIVFSKVKNFLIPCSHMIMTCRWPWLLRSKNIPDLSTVRSFFSCTSRSRTARHDFHNSHANHNWCIVIENIGGVGWWGSLFQ